MRSAAQRSVGHGVGVLDRVIQSSKPQVRFERKNGRAQHSTMFRAAVVIEGALLLCFVIYAKLPTWRKQNEERLESRDHARAQLFLATLEKLLSRKTSSPYAAEHIFLCYRQNKSLCLLQIIFVALVIGSILVA